MLIKTQTELTVVGAFLAVLFLATTEADEIDGKVLLCTYALGGTSTLASGTQFSVECDFNSMLMTDDKWLLTCIRNNATKKATDISTGQSE